MWEESLDAFNFGGGIEIVQGSMVVLVSLGNIFRWIPWKGGLLYLATSVGMTHNGPEAQLGAMEQTASPAPSFSFEKD